MESGPRDSVGLCRSLRFLKQPVESIAIEEFPSDDNGMDLPRVADVFQRIRLQQDEIRPSAHGNKAAVVVPQELGHIACGRLQRLHWCESGAYQQFKFIVQVESGIRARDPGIGAGKQAHACVLHLLYQWQCSLELLLHSFVELRSQLIPVAHCDVRRQFPG